MGMYSEFVCEELEVLTSREEIAKLEMGFFDPPVYKTWKDNDGVTFQAWNDSKLYGYLTEKNVRELKKLLPHIRGWAEFIYEEGFAFRLVFSDEGLFIKVQNFVNWDAIESEEL
jgi:hypothetical protein